MYRLFENVDLLYGECIYLKLKFEGFVSAKLLKLCDTKDDGWLWCRFDNCSSVVDTFIIFCDSSYVFGFVDNFLL